ncbi:MAG TPA: NADH-quinone oxidoreductase subunit N [Puia sp.]|jgi:NADH-quinone oxidoreductase subunit N|nr:NADH-quinone oxidoreductase subunit N [Puia sp.]
MNSIITSAILGVIMMFSGIFLKKNSSIAALATLSAILLLAMAVLDMSGYHFFPVDSHNMLDFQAFGQLANCIAFAMTLAYFLLNGRDIAAVGNNPGEYFALIFFVLCGISIATSFNSLLMLFIGIEIISIPLYILTGSDKRNLKSNEASLKYFLMGAFSTGIMLLGIAFLYGASEKGSFFVDDIASVKAIGTPMMMTGLILLMVSMSFKISAAPFHFWTPDVYDGAPTVITSFMATVVKAGTFIAFIRLFYNAFDDMKSHWQIFIAIIAATTLFVGNITAVFQQSVKRMLAYSSIAQVGFMLLAILTLNTLAKEGIILYIAVYGAASVGLFAVLVKMKDFSFDGFNGLARHEPVLAFTSAVFLLSLAGIPLTGGFLAKYYMIASVVQTGSWLWLVIFALLCATVSVYYYFRVIQAMYFKEGLSQNLEISTGFKFMLILLALIVILLGIFPQLLISRLYIAYI